VSPSLRPHLRMANSIRITPERDAAIMVNFGRLPAFFRAQLQGRDTVQRALGNSVWLFADQLLRMGVGLCVGVWMARHLGPENYGWLNLAIATVGMVAALTTPAINAIVVREVARAPAASARWIGALFFLRSMGATLGFLACVIIAWQRDGALASARGLTVVVAAGMLLQMADVVDVLLQGRGEARIGAKVRMTACLCGAGLRVALIWTDAPLIAFAAAGLVETAVAALGWLWIASKAGFGITSWLCERRLVTSLLQEGWPLALASIAITTQAFVDQLVIGGALGAAELGQYSAAMRLVSAFTFLPMVVHTVSAPEIARAKQDDEALYRRRLHGLYRVMGGLFWATGMPLVLVGPFALEWLYGAAYSPAAALLPWLAWRLLLTNLGVARSLFLANEGLLRFGMWTSLAGAGVNLCLNLILVPRWGAEGAIVAALVSFGVTTFAFEALDRKTLGNLRLMGCAVLLPWRAYKA
jgi:O-antigen/teichoic acid export membrane protein